jgi:hypothetical protein
MQTRRFRVFIRYTAILLLCVFFIPQVSSAAPRTTPFTVGETLDPGAESVEPCGPTDANCFPSVLSVSDEGTTLHASASQINFVGSGVTAASSTGGLITVTIPGDNIDWMSFVSASSTSYSTQVGFGAGANLNGAGTSNTAIGDWALHVATSSVNNTAVGSGALGLNTSGGQNTAVGVTTLASNTTGSDNNAFGASSLFSNTTGSSNSAFGHFTLNSNTTGLNNSAFGTQALSSNTTGSYNTALGINAGSNIVTGSNNIMIGNGTNGTSTSATNQLNIGNTLYGNLATGNVSIGTWAQSSSKLYIYDDEDSRIFVDSPGIAMVEVGGGLASTTLVSVRGSEMAVTQYANNASTAQWVAGLTDGTNNFRISDSLAGQTRLSIDSIGNVGIGTTSPSGKLTVWGSGTGTNSLVNFVDSASTSLFTVLENGNVGIGTPSPLAVLHVNSATDVPRILLSTSLAGVGRKNWSIQTDKIANGDFAISYGATGTVPNTAALYINNSGNVGIGTTSPTQQLSLAGSLALTHTIDATTGVVYKGSGSFLHNYATSSSSGENTFLGINSGNFTMGSSTGSASLGTHNTGVGANTLSSLTVGYSNVAVGDSSGQFTTTGIANSFFGSSAGQANTTGGFNSFFGANAGLSNTSGTNNTFIGDLAGYTSTTSVGNSFVGSRSGRYTTTGNYNSFFGYNSGLLNTVGARNSFVGFQSGINNIGGNDNTFLGYDSGFSNTYGTSSVFIGKGAGEVNTIGSGNTFLGFQSGWGGSGTPTDNWSVVDTNMVLIGMNATRDASVPSTTILTNATAIGYDAKVGCSNCLVLGSTTVSVGIGTSTPTAQLTTTGTVRFSNFGAGTLQTDADGNLSVSSDERLKNISGPFARGIDALRGVDPISYHWKQGSGFDTTELYTGFSAQNIQEFIPEAIGIDKHGFLTLSDRPLLATVINATKEQQVILDELILASSSVASRTSGDSFWPRLTALVGNFVDGVLTVVGIHSDEVQTKELCIGEEGDRTCITKDRLDSLLLNEVNNSSDNTPNSPNEENIIPDEDSDDSVTDTDGETVDDSSVSGDSGDSDVVTDTDDEVVTDDSGVVSSDDEATVEEIQTGGEEGSVDVPAEAPLE